MPLLLMLLPVVWSCACEPRKNVTWALARAEAPVRPWTRSFVERRCELWCRSANLAAALQWVPHRVASQPSEPLLGWRSLANWADGTLQVVSSTQRGATTVAFQSSSPPKKKRDALVVAWSVVPTKNATAVVEAVVEAAERRGKCRVLLLATGDRPFPPTPGTPTLEVWATNVPETAPAYVKPMPIGLSAGPSKAWAETVTATLKDGGDAKLSDRTDLLLCGGYRLDAKRRQGLDALRRQGFACAAPAKVTTQAYWTRLKAAKLVFCPSGFGLATFRTYEALLAGAVPLLPRHPRHDALFRDLPVLFVRFDDDRWLFDDDDDDDERNRSTSQKNVQVSPASLQARYATILRSRHRLDLRRAFAPFWLAALARATLDPSSSSSLL
mmetsp:Transcript_1650/g.4933  ORF Transcript_1650/g.4933 Transcript_1650/m.4933 type:complete len:384 (-) Transcript_1650:94-1245(-)